MRKHGKTTTERGYGSDHKEASNRYRQEHPLCERCMMVVGVIAANPSEELHHVVSIADNAGKRLTASNWLALCRACHEEVESDVMAGMAVRRWSDVNYVIEINRGM